MQNEFTRVIKQVQFNRKTFFNRKKLARWALESCRSLVCKTKTELKNDNKQFIYWHERISAQTDFGTRLVLLHMVMQM